MATHHLIITCPPQVLEYCHSARSAEEYEDLAADMAVLLPAFEHPSESLAITLQRALWERGMPRAAVAFDCLIAAYAVVNDAIVLNSDHDFGHIERATDGRLRQEFVPE
ncbi:VapC toxin family PIN domain ribonuclease [Microbacterium dauci]|uniref:VapC toxin family PIN domain ribonuclease n=1 Tax=Microbacterium dauci TaxID=3048008 RepID=A0ABT6ZGR6_9MICO|nr:VapC toxin family PIN domain ribonuclease [Microbacterium sp. LX3-4]MDJ1115356.1 VapC toxin family PIN domain ribonuclease [Microbacterium sp. LX3-4]